MMTSVKRARVKAGAALLLVALLTAGCGSQGESADGGRQAPDTASSATATRDADMKGMDMGGADAPSQPASMICSKEIQDAVTRTFALSTPPQKSDSWSRSDRVYSCTYRVPGGRLTLSVKDVLQEEDGRAYFTELRAKLPDARTIRGVQSLGFPSFETTGGQVAFLKDGKTLVVDASRVMAAALPQGYSGPEAAYSVAAAVIACWSE